MTKNQVKKIEKEKLIGEDELTLRYFTIINKLEFKLEYEFRNDSLKKVLYTTTRSYNPDIQLNIFLLLKDIINEKYQVKPTSRHIIPSQYKNNLISGIKNGVITLNDEWSTPKTYIELKLVCDKNGYINTTLVYLEKEYKDLLDNLKNKDNNKNKKKRDIKKEREDLKKYF